MINIMKILKKIVHEELDKLLKNNKKNNYNYKKEYNKKGDKNYSENNENFTESNDEELDYLINKKNNINLYQNKIINNNFKK